MLQCIFAGLVPDKFSLTFSMKHARGTKDDQKNKRNILCESDEDGEHLLLHVPRNPTSEEG